MFEETKQTLTDMSFVRRKTIVKRNAGVSTQISDQMVATRVVSRTKITDRGRRMESIAKIAREEKRGHSAQDTKHEPGSHKSVAEPNMDQMRQMIQQLSMMLQTNTQQFNDIASNLAINFLNTNWVLDSGATDHMTDDKNLLNNYKCYEGKQFVVVANDDKIKILGSGSIIIFFKNHSKCLACKKLCIQLDIH
jgi:hypothetical protein